MIFAQLLFAASSTPNGELSITPTKTGSGVSLDLQFKPFTGYLAFGYGGTSMTNQNIVVIMQNGQSFTASSYHSDSRTTPTKVTDVWKVVSSGNGKMTITGNDSKYPINGGTFIYANGAVTNGQIQQHTTVYGTFSVGPATAQVQTATTSAPTPSSIPGAVPKSQATLMLELPVGSTGSSNIPSSAISPVGVSAADGVPTVPTGGSNPSEILLKIPNVSQQTFLTKLPMSTSTTKVTSNANSLPLSAVSTQASITPGPATLGDMVGQFLCQSILQQPMSNCKSSSSSIAKAGTTSLSASSSPTLLSSTSPGNTSTLNSDSNISSFSSSSSSISSPIPTYKSVPSQSEVVANGNAQLGNAKNIFQETSDANGIHVKILMFGFMFTSI